MHPRENLRRMLETLNETFRETIMRKGLSFIGCVTVLVAPLICHASTLQVVQNTVTGPTGTYTPYAPNGTSTPVTVSPATSSSDTDSSGGVTYGDTNYRVNGASQVEPPTPGSTAGVGAKMEKVPAGSLSGHHVSVPAAAP